MKRAKLLAVKVGVTIIAIVTLNWDMAVGVWNPAVRDRIIERHDADA